MPIVEVVHKCTYGCDNLPAPATCSCQANLIAKLILLVSLTLSYTFGKRFMKTINLIAVALLLIDYHLAKIQYLCIFLKLLLTHLTLQLSKLRLGNSSQSTLCPARHLGTLGVLRVVGVANQTAYSGECKTYVCEIPSALAILLHLSMTFLHNLASVGKVVLFLLKR